MAKEKDFTIVRRRIVTQISTEQYRASSPQEALSQANRDQENDKNADAFSQDANEWYNLTDAVDYPFLDNDAILEVNTVMLP